MKYFLNLDNQDLIQYNPETQVYKKRNTIERSDSRIDIQGLNIKKLNKDNYCRLMNIFYKNVDHSWVYDNKNFMKMPNFKETEHQLSSNYVFGKDVPFHKIEGKEWLGNVILVYHWGKVYYHTISYGGYKQGQLIDTVNYNLVRWAQLKHCSPILNIDTNKIV